MCDDLPGVYRLMAVRKALTRIVLFFALGIACVLVVFVGAQRYGDQWLRAELVTSKVDLGIPGVTKAYEARLVNGGLLPTRIDRCDFVDDAFSKGKMVAFAVERWNESAQGWKAVVQLDRASFCKPYPLGIMQAKLVHGCGRASLSQQARRRRLPVEHSIVETARGLLSF
jgi:hypothetical protein